MKKIFSSQRKWCLTKQFSSLHTPPSLVLSVSLMTAQWSERGSWGASPFFQLSQVTALLLRLSQDKNLKSTYNTRIQYDAQYLFWYHETTFFFFFFFNLLTMHIACWYKKSNWTHSEDQLFSVLYLRSSPSFVRLSVDCTGGIESH